MGDVAAAIDAPFAAPETDSFVSDGVPPAHVLENAHKLSAWGAQKAGFNGERF